MDCLRWLDSESVGGGLSVIITCARASLLPPHCFLDIALSPLLRIVLRNIKMVSSSRPAIVEAMKALFAYMGVSAGN